MSKTVSFRCSDELDDFLETEAERRMTTKSTVAQILVAERATQMMDGDQDADYGVETLGESSDRDVMQEYSDHWYRAESDKYKFALRLPDDADVHDDRRYYKTERGLRTALRKWYESRD
jgi:hypothetical protein